MTLDIRLVTAMLRGDPLLTHVASTGQDCLGFGNFFLKFKRSRDRCSKMVRHIAIWKTSYVGLILCRMNCVSLDSIGLAGFGHDFGSLQGRKSAVSEVFDAFGMTRPSYFEIATILLGSKIPFLGRIPSPRKRLNYKLHHSLEEVSKRIFASNKAEKEVGGMTSDMSRSIIEILRMSILSLTVIPPFVNRAP